MPSLYIPVKPRPKARPRMSRKGHVYTPKDTLDVEAAIGGEWARHDLPTIDVPCEVWVEYEKDGMHVTIEEIPNPPKSSQLRGDLDNYVKATLDALNKIAFTDDRLVWRLHACKTGQGGLDR